MNIYGTNFLDDLTAEIDDALNNENKIHISTKQRNARQATTIIENIDTNPIIKKTNKTLQMILTTMKKEFHCGGSCETNETDKNVIILQGDKRNNVKEYMKKTFNLDDSSFIIHG